MISAIPCSLFPLISRIHSSLFLDWRGTISSKFFGTQVPSISTEKLMLPRHARFVLSCLHCNGHSLLLSSISLGSAESRILHAVLADTSHLILHCPATDSLRHTPFGDSLSLYDHCLVLSITFLRQLISQFFRKPYQTNSCTEHRC